MEPGNMYLQIRKISLNGTLKVTQLHCVTYVKRLPMLDILATVAFNYFIIFKALTINVTYDIILIEYVTLIGGQ
ncbi:MAG: hypothetical protein H6Q67_1307 [Firmicutes bacterium]|nr:hypothetical protein [Bacillota bacterium]